MSDEKVKTSKRVKTFLWVGILLTVIDFVLFELLVLLFFRGTDQASIATAVAGVISTCFGYLMHSRITWKEREVRKINIVKFFLWHTLVFVALRPLLIWFFGQVGGLYDFAYELTKWMGFSRDFVASTGAYVLTTIVTMTINFICYDKIVFGKKPPTEEQML